VSIRSDSAERKDNPAIT